MSRGNDKRDLMNEIRPKRLTIISFVGIYVLCFVVVLIRWINLFNVDFVFINQEINSHISNFTLSVSLCVFIGYLLLMAGKKYRLTLIVGSLIIGLNFIYEMYLPFLNTRDIVDAIYGLGGVLFSLVYLYFISKYEFERMA